MDSYVDVGDEPISIDILHETLKHRLTSLSRTNDLYLIVGGIPSNVGSWNFKPKKIL